MIMDLKSMYVFNDAVKIIWFVNLIVTTGRCRRSLKYNNEDDLLSKDPLKTGYIHLINNKQPA